MVRDNAKASDGLLDWANERAARVTAALDAIFMYEQVGRTAGETEILNNLKGILRK